MKKRVAVFTDDEYLYQKIYLTLSQHFACERAFGARADGFDLCLFDARGGGKAPLGTPTVTMSREGGDLKIPFSPSALISAVSSTRRAARLTLGDRCVYLNGEKIHLSELEFSLLALLVGADGEFVTRDEILRRVWDSEKGHGIINVYVHYLREKLEASGERIIISRHGYGYKIDEKFLREESEAAPVSN